jgi:hypothetical protein
MSEANSPCVWLEKADHDLAQFTGDVADNKRQLTQEAKEQKIKQTVQGPHLVLRNCEVGVVKPRNDYTPKALAATDPDSKTLRNACKRVAKSAHGPRGHCLPPAQDGNTVMPDAIFTQLNDDHNDGDHNDGDHNDGDHNDGDDNGGDHNDGDHKTTTTAITSAASATTAMALTASAVVLAHRLCLNPPAW